MMGKSAFFREGTAGQMKRVPPFAKDDDSTLPKEPNGSKIGLGPKPIWGMSVLYLVRGNGLKADSPDGADPSPILAPIGSLGKLDPSYWRKTDRASGIGPIPRSKMAIFLSYGRTSPVSLSRTMTIERLTRSKWRAAVAVPRSIAGCRRRGFSEWRTRPSGMQCSDQS